MAKYKNNAANSAAVENERFSQSVVRLKNLITVKEMDRRHWAKENFGNPEGLNFKICRILIPIFSLFVFISMFIYCYIRDMQAVIGNLQDDYMGLAYDADISQVGIIIVFVLIMCIALFVGNILLFFKKTYVGAYMNLTASIALGVHLLTQMSIPMPSSNENYVTLCIICSVVYFVLALLNIYLLICKYKVVRTVKRMTDEIMIKISNGTNEMLTPELYAEKIEQYIEREKNKIVAEKSGGKDSLIHFDGDGSEEE